MTRTSSKPTLAARIETAAARALADRRHVAPVDVLLNLGGQPAKGVGEVRKILLGLGKEALEVKLIREGKPRRMSLVGPEHGFPPEAAEFWIGTPVSPVDTTLRHTCRPWRTNRDSSFGPAFGGG